jgi:hypothetical protein
MSFWINSSDFENIWPLYDVIVLSLARIVLKYLSTIEEIREPVMRQAVHTWNILVAFFFLSNDR